MLRRLSLQARLSLFLSLLLGFTLLGSAIAIIAYSQEQLSDEHGSSAGLAQQYAEMLNRYLEDCPTPDEMLEKLITELPPTQPGRFGILRAGGAVDVSKLVTSSGAPAWFDSLITTNTRVERFPILISGRPVGDVVFMPDLSADIFEKWAAFLAIVVSGIALTILSAFLAYFTVRTTLQPLQTLEATLVRLRSGDYGVQVRCDGPPEIERSVQELNELSSTLCKLDLENRHLLRKGVEIQDEERRDLSRELHDELGPQLFAIRATAISLMPDTAPSGDPRFEKLLRAVEDLQQANRRILDRLRPMHIQELGLVRSIEGLIRDAASQKSSIAFSAAVDPAFVRVEPVAAQTIYRVVQETLTNALRHSEATQVNVAGTLEGSDARLEISDDGIGLPPESLPGRGITGMRERIRALGGTFQITRRGGRTVVAVSLPTERASVSPPPV
jgi:two-component system sensor histidine kinase UhpB